MTVTSIDDLVAMGDKGHLDSGVVYQVVGDINTPVTQKGIFYFLANALPPSFSAGQQSQLASGGVLFRPTSQTPQVRAEWFGAKGDGVSDDSIAIQAALDNFKRVDFEAKTYGIGKGLYVATNQEGSKSIAQSLWNQYFAIVIRSGYKLLGAGKNRTKLRLNDNTNPRPSNLTFALLGSSIVESAANVVVRDLHIDLNFDGQSKAQRAPDDVMVDGNSTYTRQNSHLIATLPNGNKVYGPDVATISALHIYGPNLLAENLLITGYSSNVDNEAFVIFSALAMRDMRAPRTCATIRGVEMTAPGSNLDLKYRKKGGRLSLQGNSKYEHIAEITHIVVGGALNFYNQPYTAGGYSVPGNHQMWERVLEVDTIEDARSRTALPIPSIVKVVHPDAAYFYYDPHSLEGFNNLTSFAIDSGVLDPLPGRIIKLPARSAPPLIDLEFSSTPEMLGHFRSLPLSLRPEGTRIIKVRNDQAPAAEFFAVYPKVSTIIFDDIEYFEGTGVNSPAYLRRIMPRPVSGQCSGWNCDPAFDESWLGENATNVWPCEGGVIENNYIHDEFLNPEAYDQMGVRYGITNPNGINASHLHGISLAGTTGTVVRNNLFERFQGLGVFIMSWWNDELRVIDNTFDEVMGGVSLAVFVEHERKPVQWPRHRNIRILNNYINLMPYTVAPSGYYPFGFGLSDYSWTTTYPNSLPLDIYPRFDTVEFAFNRIVGRSADHVNQSLGRQYSIGVSIFATSFLKNLRIHNNLFDIDPHLGFQVRSGGRDTTAITLYPGQPYQMRDYGVHDMYFFNNYDLRGGHAYNREIDAALKDLSVMPTLTDIPPTAPLLINYMWTPYAYGDERVAQAEVPANTPTASPTHTPIFTPTPKPTNTASVTPTLQPTSTPTFTPTPRPTNTASPTPTSQPGLTSVLTRTPQPTVTLTPTRTPQVMPTNILTPTIVPTQSASQFQVGCSAMPELQIEADRVLIALSGMIAPTGSNRWGSVRQDLNRVIKQVSSLLALSRSRRAAYPDVAIRILPQLTNLRAKLLDAQRAIGRQSSFNRTIRRTVNVAKALGVICSGPS